MFHRFVAIVIVFVSQYSVISAVVAAPQSSIWLSYSEDEDEVKDTYLDLFWAVNQDDTLSFSAGQSQSEFLGAEIESDYYHVGYETLRTLPASVKLYYDYWGKNREFEIHTTGLNLGYHTENVSLGLNYKYRQINIYTRTLMSGQRKFDITSDGYGPELYIYVDKLTWFVQGTWYDYSDNAEPLFTLAELYPYRALFILGRKSYDRAGSINDWEAVTGVQYQFDDVMLGLLYMKSASAIDGEISETYALTLRADLTESWVLELSAGQVDDDSSDAIAYGSLGIGYRF